MRKVIIYVEGRSDRDAMEQHLGSLIDDRRAKGVAVEFIGIRDSGHNKKTLLKDVPRRAANIVGHDPTAVIVALPDLYPRDVEFPHSTFAELDAGLKKLFVQALRQKKLDKDTRLLQRFQVFCFKHDLEALCPASVGIGLSSVGW